ncbi:uncharacterized protein DFL_003735 [Arthrobotrys flagrans]|uniref:Uncharacterized protein n=1 Tax=Arthrobotrys flagrans TaxID=97331 RepID=A0A437A2R3_ARTFL|nr:hypothetical protein DFL_003735 [Arthrobotrys flagrans]
MQSIEDNELLLKSRAHVQSQRSDGTTYRRMSVSIVSSIMCCLGSRTKKDEHLTEDFEITEGNISEQSLVDNPPCPVN